MRICSPIKVTHDSVVLVTYEATGPNGEKDHLADLVGLQGGQSVQPAPAVGAASQDRFARGNETHTLEFTRVRKYGSAVLALQAMVVDRAPTAASRAKADATIEVEGGDTYTLADAVIESWGGRLMEDGLSVAQRFRLTGATIS